MIGQKSIKLKDIVNQKVLLRIITPSSMEQSFYNIPIDFDVKRYEPKKNLTRGQGEDYTTGCLIKKQFSK